MALPTIRDKNKKYVIYRDIDINFDQHPLSNDVTVNTDSKSVSESMKHLLLTNRGERLFNPSLGGDLRAYLFENKYSQVIDKLIEEKVKDTINTYEPRAIIERIEVNSSMDDNNVQIQIFYYVINSETLNKTIILLERTR